MSSNEGFSINIDSSSETMVVARILLDAAPWFPWSGGDLLNFVDKLPGVGKIVDITTAALKLVAIQHMQANLTVEMYKTQNDLLTVIVKGSHSIFPVYQVYVNDTSVYRSSDTILNQVTDPLVSMRQNIDVLRTGTKLETVINLLPA